MRKMLSSTGVTAVAAKRSSELSMPPCKRHQRNEHEIGERDARELDREREFRGLGAEARRDDIEDPGRQHLARQQEQQQRRSSTASASSAKRRAASLPSFATLPAKSGTKAALKAPSANRLRNILGRRSATKNASETGPAPRKAAINISRTKPSTRLTMV